jgi:uncharacterized protein YegJ (DUF2314 family)
LFAGQRPGHGGTRGQGRAGLHARGRAGDAQGLRSRQRHAGRLSGQGAISQGDNTEYFWVNGLTQKPDGSFEGTIANEPRMVRTVKFGQRYGFARARIVDWTYIDKGKRAMVGNFTLCALLTKESRSEAEAMKRRFKIDCDWLTP